MSEYTKGPWEAQKLELLSGREVTEIVTLKYDVVAHDVGIRNDADANLIAAAPDMLEALEAIESIKDIWLPSEIDEEHIHEALALHKVREKYLRAIAKAKGENQ